MCVKELTSLGSNFFEQKYEKEERFLKILYTLFDVRHIISLDKEAYNL